MKTGESESPKIPTSEYTELKGFGDRNSDMTRAFVTTTESRSTNYRSLTSGSHVIIMKLNY